MKIQNYNLIFRGKKKYIFIRNLIFITIELVLSVYLLNSIGMNFNNFEKGVLISINLIASLLFILKLYYLLDLLKNKKSILIYICLNLYVAFSFSGNYLFLYPLNINVNFYNILMYLITAICMFPITSAVIILLNIASTKMVEEHNISKVKSNYIKVWIIYFVIIMSVEIIYLIAFNPAVLTYDSLYQISQAKGLDPLENWHPPFITLIIRLLLSIVDTPSILAIVQCTFYASVCSSFMLFLYQNGIKLKYSIILTIILAIMPNNSIYCITVWKDISYSICILWLTLLFVKLIINFKKYDNKLYYMQLSICLIFTCMFRQNGIVVYAISLLGILVYKKFNYKTIIVAIVTIVTIITINGPLYGYLGVIDGPKGGKYIGLSQDMVGVYFWGGDVSSETKKIIEKLTSANDYKYSPYWSNLSFDLDIKVSEFLKCYIDTFVRNPKLMARTILCRVDVGWNLTTGKDGLVVCIGDITDKIQIEKYDNLYPARSENFLTNILTKVIVDTRKSLNFDIFWREGLYLLMIIICCTVLCIKKNYKLLFMLIPLLGQIISLLLSTGWMDYRYFWPISLVGYYFVISYLTYNRKSEENAI